MTFPHTATIQKQSETSGKWIYASTGTTECFLQPLDSEASQLYGITFSKAFVCFVPDDTAVQEGHRLLIDGVKYGVKGLREHNYGSLQHKRVILEKL